MRLGYWRRRAIRGAYYTGVIDALEHAAPNPGIVQGAYGHDVELAQRQGWFDGTARRALRPYEFDAAEVLRRAEIREAFVGQGSGAR